MRPLTLPEYLRNLVRGAIAYPGYRQRERLDATASRDQALRRAFAMARHAARMVPLYRERYHEAGINLDLPVPNESAALFRELPLITKSDFLMAPERALAEGTRLADCLLSTSSGSTGAMLTVPRRADGLWPHMLSTQRLLAWAAGGHYPTHWRQAYVYTSMYPLPSVPLLYPMRFFPTSANPLESVAALEDYRPAILSTYPSILRDLLSVAPVRMRALRLRGVSVGSELSTPSERAAWSVLLGAPVRDEYSSEELGRIASECPEGAAHLHEENVYLEVLDAAGRPTEEVGEIVGTEFYNTAHPFVRYRQGDLGRISDERCPCGRAGRLLVELTGRKNDAFCLADGSSLAPGFLLDLCYRALIAAGEGAIAAYRLVQIDGRQATFYYVRGTTYTPATPQLLAASFSHELPRSLTIILQEVETLQRLPSGKRTTIVAAR